MLPRKSEADRVKLWFKRIKQANRLYKDWALAYLTKNCEEYYYGRHHRGIEEAIAKKMYTINLVYSSIETNKPALIFHRPQVRVQPRPGRARTFGSDADKRARLQQDTIQTFIDDPDIGFEAETALALQESHFRFGVIEVGYSSDWIVNPNAGKPTLKEDSNDPLLDSQNNEIPQPDRIVEDEELYIKWIPANSFRVSVSNRNVLARNDWSGYYEWMYLEDIKRNKDYNTTGLKSSGQVRLELQGGDSPESEDDKIEIELHSGMIKVWKIWDHRRKKQHILAEGHQRFLIEDVEFKYLPFGIIKVHEILNSFYPMPPVFQWLGPQDEVNETREMQRAHRRRFYRRYTVDPGVDKNELKKLEDGGDGVYAEIPRAQAPIPVADAPLDGSVWRNLDESKSDFLQVSGVTYEQRGVADSETATQATIIDVRSRIRESAARTKVSTWLAEVSRLILLTIRDKMVLPLWGKQNADPFAASKNAESDAIRELTQAVMASSGVAAPPPDDGGGASGGPGSPEEVAELWKEISAEELGTTDIEVSIDLASMSPVTEETLRNQWSQVLVLLTNPSLLAIFAQSEVIARKTLTLYGIRAENEIREIMKVARLLVMQMQAAAQQAAAAKGGGEGAGTPASTSATGSNGVAGGGNLMQMLEQRLGGAVQ
jgi:hypothetical protein